jgi:hypothetical protein
VSQWRTGRETPGQQLDNYFKLAPMVVLQQTSLFAPDFG